MPLEIQMPDQDVEHLNEPAKSEFRDCVAKFAHDLTEEASRLEAAIKTTPGNPEITSSMVRDAYILLKRGYKKPRKPWWLVASQIIASLATLSTGFVIAKLDEPWGLMAFVFSFGVAAFFTILTIFKE